MAPCVSSPRRSTNEHINIWATRPTASRCPISRVLLSTDPLCISVCLYRLWRHPKDVACATLPLVVMPIAGLFGLRGAGRRPRCRGPRYAGGQAGDSRHREFSADQPHRGNGDASGFRPDCRRRHVPDVDVREGRRRGARRVSGGRAEHSAFAAQDKPWTPIVWAVPEKYVTPATSGLTASIPADGPARLAIDFELK